MSLLKPHEDWWSDYIMQLDWYGPYLNPEGQVILSHHLIAKILVDPMRNMYRYNPNGKGLWYQYNGQRWDPVKSVYNVVLNAIEEMRLKLNTKHDKSTVVRMFLKSDAFLAGDFVRQVIRDLESNTDLHVADTDFDTDDTIVNTPGGVYKLQNGASVGFDASYMCRWMTSVAPLDDLDGTMCPNYMNHLKFISDNKPDLINYLEELSGYILTGLTFQQEFYWFCGLAKTGKSALTGIWFDILSKNGYAELGQQRQFAEVYNEPHAAQDFRLIGKRFILTEEPKANKWNEEKLKAFTSGGEISARPMFGDFITFNPVGKLFFASNNQPAVEGGDGGIARRLKLIPFTRVIPADMRIKDFRNTVLAKEAPYILNRMIKYAGIVIKNQALTEPQIVTDKSSSYMQSNDLLAQFIDDCCTTESYDTETMKNLHKAFGMWCDENSYDAPTQNKFGRMLSSASYELVKLGGGRRMRSKIKLNTEWANKVGLYINADRN